MALALRMTSPLSLAVRSKAPAPTHPLLLPDRTQLTQAVTVFSAIWQVTSVAAPAIAGFVIAYAGAGYSFLASTLSLVKLLSVTRTSLAELCMSSIALLIVAASTSFKFVAGCVFDVRYFN